MKKIRFFPLIILIAAMFDSYACNQQAKDEGAASDPNTVLDDQLAFPGAEGFGRFAKGGRGGDVYHVINLNDDGPGSLRYGLSQAKGPRTIVFDVSGNIRLKSRLEIEDKAFITIAGQTAPGDGITLCDYPLTINNCHDMIIRYIRIRLGDENKPKPAGFDAMTTNDIDNFIFDHVSISWGIDGNHDLRRGSNFTLQWCILGEALNHSLHEEGAHAMLGSYRNPTGNLTLHHNLLTTSRDRHPTLGSGGDSKDFLGHTVDFRNNVIYNWSKNVNSDEADSEGGATNFCDNMVVAINNVWKPGPESDPELQPISIKGDQPSDACGFMSGNVFIGRDDWTQDNYAALNFERWKKNPGYLYDGNLEDWKKPEPELGDDAPDTEQAMDAYELILQNAGASLRRDPVDERLVNNVRNTEGWLIDSQSEVGGYPELQSEPAPKDSDRDGMPDDWETKNGFDPDHPEDRNGDKDGDGYTNLEEYLNSLIRMSVN